MRNKRIELRPRPRPDRLKPGFDLRADERTRAWAQHFRGGFRSYLTSVTGILVPCATALVGCFSNAEGVRVLKEVWKEVDHFDHCSIHFG